MICPHCQAPDQDGTFCRKCGAPLDENMDEFTRVMPPLDGERLEEVEDESFVREEELAEGENLTDTSNIQALIDDAISDTGGDTAYFKKVSAGNDQTSSFDPLDMTSIFDGVLDEDNLDEEARAKALKEAKLQAWLHDEDVPREGGDALPVPVYEDDGHFNEEEDEKELKKQARRKVFTVISLFVGILLAALAAVYLFTSAFDTTPEVDPSQQVKEAEVIAPDKTLAEDTIVGHWRHYSQGSTIEKIGTSRYRWTIGKKVYQLDYKDNQYIYEDESDNTYTFVLTSSERLQLAASATPSGGIIANPIFEAGYLLGRVGEDGAMTANVTVNADAFNIVGKTYAELAGLYGPGALTVIGDNQYIVFRANGGNFAVQFTGDTVPLSAETENSYEVVPLTNTAPVEDGSTTDDDNNTTDEDEKTDYTVKIPDMPTFPSTSAVATGVLWADLGFVVNNCPNVLSVQELANIFGIALETGTAPENTSGFTFYGMEEGYFSGTYALNEHTYYISGYGNSALSAEKTTIFIEQIS